MTKTKKLSDNHKKLYHYTTWEGLDGILDSQCLWATHHKHSNDHSEGEVFKKQLLPFLISAIKNEIIKRDGIGVVKKANKCSAPIGGWEGVNKLEAEKYLDSMYSAFNDSFIGPFVFSFCAHLGAYEKEHGILSQWRGYANPGVALVIDAKKLEKLKTLEVAKYSKNHYAVALEKVVYEGDPENSFEKAFKKEIQGIENYYRALIVSPKPPPSAKLANKALNTLLRCTCLCKSQGFHEEKEVRIIAISSENGKEGKKKPKIDFRNDGRPYIEIFKDLGQKIPIEKIIVGPQNDQMRKYEALKLRTKGMHIDVVVSEIPYIGK
ncbi:MAG: DUF2971 domain-containing protein [Bdellovibrionales bacterium]|jgi:hypothetical protein